MVIIMNKRYLRSIRLLAECMQLFEKFSGAHVRRLGLTAAQFDVIATLGNTAGMTCKHLGENTLITKGTLTGVLDRLEEKGLVQRSRADIDKRQMTVKLTPCGEDVFQQTFPQIVESGQQLFHSYNETDFAALERELLKLKKNLSLLKI
jgi:DNA-binding MarR family transcriptional regulator